MTIGIEKVSNGYVLCLPYGRREVYTDVQELFEELLAALEGRRKSFGGDMYGRVEVSFEPPRETP